MLPVLCLPHSCEMENPNLPSSEKMHSCIVMCAPSKDWFLLSFSDRWEVAKIFVCYSKNNFLLQKPNRKPLDPGRGFSFPVSWEQPLCVLSKNHSVFLGFCSAFFATKNLRAKAKPECVGMGPHTQGGGAHRTTQCNVVCE